MTNLQAKILKDSIENAKKGERAKIYKDLIEIADAYECETMRVEVERYFNEK